MIEWDDLVPSGRVILGGLVGSQAYGLAHEDSDEDRLGVFVAPTVEFLGIHKVEQTRVRAAPSPDSTLHEALKYITLALACNPTVTELMWLNSYEVVTKEGYMLLANREKFLSNSVKQRYGGYARGQMKELEKRADGSFKSKLRKRYSKHARHCARLILQGTQLLETGALQVKLDDPEAIRAVGEMAPDDLIPYIEDQFLKFEQIESVLPDRPDFEAINDLLVDIRRLN